MRGRASWYKAAMLALVLAGGSGCVSSGQTAPPGQAQASPVSIESQSAPPTSTVPSAAEPTFTPGSATPTKVAGEPANTPCPAILPNGAPAPAGTTAPAAPAGTWSSVHWRKLPANSLPNEFTTCVSGDYPNPGRVYVFGWSKGFVALGIGYDGLGGVATAIPYVSSDGLTWHRGKPISLASLYVPEVNNGPDQFDLIEGPAGLAVVATETPQLCGWAPPILDAVLTSKDGLHWSFMSLKAFGEGPVDYVAGGGAGYLATGSNFEGVSAAWTSTDLVTWHKVPLGTAGFKNSLIQHGAVFSGGFVMTGYTWNMEGCIGPDPLMVKPAAWLSADGVTWSRVSLPGTSLGTNVETSIYRITDHLLLVTASASTGGKITGREYWISHDGVAWSKIPAPGLDLYLVGDGVRAFVIKCPDDTLAGCHTSRPTIEQFDDNLAATTVAQIGFAFPKNAFNRFPSAIVGHLAVGPTGFVYVADDGTIWFGAPAA